MALTLVTTGRSSSEHCPVVDDAHCSGQKKLWTYFQSHQGMVTPAPLQHLIVLQVNDPWKQLVKFPSICIWACSDCWWWLLCYTQLFVVWSNIESDETNLLTENVEEWRLWRISSSAHFNSPHLRTICPCWHIWPEAVILLSCQVLSLLHGSLTDNGSLVHCSN